MRYTITNRNDNLISHKVGLFANVFNALSVPRYRFTCKTKLFNIHLDIIIYEPFENMVIWSE